MPSDIFIVEFFGAIGVGLTILILCIAAVIGLRIINDMEFCPACRTCLSYKDLMYGGTHKYKCPQCDNTIMWDYVKNIWGN